MWIRIRIRIRSTALLIPIVSLYITRLHGIQANQMKSRLKSRPLPKAAVLLTTFNALPSRVTYKIRRTGFHFLSLYCGIICL
jgi:hypothetical protein